MTIRKRKLSQLNEDQLESLEEMLKFLNKLGALPAHHVMYRRYHDTVTTYRSSPNWQVDSMWASLYDIERIFVVDGKDHEQV